MQFRIIPALIIYLGSYLPLAVILLVQDVKSELWWKVCNIFSKNQTCTFDIFSHPWAALIVVGVTGAAFALTMFVLHRVPFRVDAVVKEVTPVPNDLINYVFPYIVSFMGIDYGNSGHLVGFLVFLVVMFVITYKSGQILMNPLLIAIGWHLYDVKASFNDVEKNVRVLKRGQLLPGCLRAEKIQGFYVMESKNAGEV